MINQAKLKELPEIIRLGQTKQLKLLHNFWMIFFFIIGKFYIYKNNNKTIAYVNRTFNFLSLLYVTPAYRNKGIAKELIYHVETVLLNKRYKKIWAYCTHGLLNFYINQKWKTSRLIRISKGLK